MRKIVLLALVICASASAVAQCSNTTYGTNYTCVASVFANSSGVKQRDFTFSVTKGNFVQFVAFAVGSSPTLTIAAWQACGNAVAQGSSVALGTNSAISLGAFAISTGTCDITVTSSVSTTIEGRYWVWSATSGPILDPGGSAQANLVSLGSITANATFSCPAVTTTNNGDLVMCFTIDGGNNGGAWTPTSPFVATTGTGSTNVTGMSDGQSTAGAITPQGKYNNTSTMGAVTVSLSNVAGPATLNKWNGLTVGNAVGNIKQINGQWINPASSYANKINSISTPFTATPAQNFIDFHAGTNTNVPAQADLTSSTYGNYGNTTTPYSLGALGTTLTYTNTLTAGNLPQPVLVGSHVYDGGGSLGLLCTAGAASPAQNLCGQVTMAFATSTPVVSVGYWLYPQGNYVSGSQDGGAHGGLTGGTDYINPHVAPIGVSCVTAYTGILMENKGGNSTTCLTLTINTLYRVNLQISEGETAFTATFSNSVPTITATQTLAANEAVQFSTSGTLPAGLSASTPYFVLSTGLSGSAFEVAATQGGSPIQVTTTGSGTQTVTPTNIEVVCSGNPPTLLGYLTGPSYTTATPMTAVDIGVSGEGPQATGYTFGYRDYVFYASGTISLTGCAL